MKKINAILILITVTFILSCATIPSVSTLPASKVTYPEKESYIIGPSDILEINVWKEPELTRKVAVRMDGKITLPMINDVQAANMPLQKLQKEIAERYKEFVEVPEVTVILLASNSRKIYMLGKIGRPGELPLTKEITILQAISISGGLQKWADKSDIRLIRKIDGVEKTFRIDYDAIISGKDLTQNIVLQPDDTIFVP
ncbi:MAG: polysaccharide biosynthesis/export family protein [Thermodesulfobacteriota bacterium]|nr:polysaccharide biosynthesis/export family protein [Thermodesulfobacteriota bacterium]